MWKGRQEEEEEGLQVGGHVYDFDNKVSKSDNSNNNVNDNNNNNNSTNNREYISLASR